MKIEPWELATLGGRIPAVRTVPNAMGEAPSKIATLKSMSGQVVCRLDFGYGGKDDLEIATAIAALPDCLKALKDLLAAQYDMQHPSDWLPGEKSRKLERAKDNAKAALKKAGCV